MINGVIISGCSGVGKTTIIERLLRQHPEFVFSVSCTTRAARPGEQNNIHYEFITREEFERRIEQKYFLEWEQVYLDFYGTPKHVLETAEGTTKVVIFELDTRGAVNLKEKFPQFSTVALLPPRLGDLAERLIQRSSETVQTIKARQEHLREELQRMKTFDFAVVNSEIDETVAVVERIVLCLNYRTKYALNHIEGLLKTL